MAEVGARGTGLLVRLEEASVGIDAGERGLARPQDCVSWSRLGRWKSVERSHCIPAAKKQWAETEESCRRGHERWLDLNGF